MRKAEIRRTLIESYKSSELIINARRIQQLKTHVTTCYSIYLFFFSSCGMFLLIQIIFFNNLQEEEVIESNVRSSTTWWKQLCTLTKKSFLNMTRDLGYYWLRIIFYVLVAISIGTLFFHIGTDNSSILARGKCVSFIYGFMICLSCGGLPFFIEELKVNN